ncbi:unnamed protein product [Rhodiola kirilowii]
MRFPNVESHTSIGPDTFVNISLAGVTYFLEVIQSSLSFYLHDIAPSIRMPGHSCDNCPIDLLLFKSHFLGYASVMQW